MKKNLTGIVIWLGVFLIIGGFTIFSEYVAEHQYYKEMLADADNRLLLLMGVVSSAIPLGYHYISPKPRISGFLWSSLVGLLVYAYGFIAIRDVFVGSAQLMLPINMLLMISGMVVILGGMWSGGAMLYRRLYRHQADTLDRSVTAFILGFVATLLIMCLLVVSTLMYQVVVLGCLGVCIYLIYREHDFLRHLARNTSDLINTHLGFDTMTKSINTILLIITTVYLFYGLMLAYIPYPTAWDANHAYMYIPKVRAEHHGYLRNSLSAQFGPSPWLAYVAFWFQWGNLLESAGLWIAPDTWGVVMNYFSVVIVMILVWGLLGRVIRYARINHVTPSYQIGWVILMSWMTSGMGAFLVFVDNKSDFGVLALSLCAIVLLFDWLPTLHHDNADNDGHTSLSSYPMMSTLLSGLIAGFAVLAKPTALFDLATIVIIFVGVMAGVGATIGSGLLIMGLMAIMKITTVPLYISTSAGVVLSVVGVLMIVLGYLRSHKHSPLQWKKFVLRGVSLFAVLIIIKTPIMAWRTTLLEGYTIGGVKGYVQSVLMGYESPHSHKSTSTMPESLGMILAQNSSAPAPQSCTLKSQGITQSELYQGTCKPKSEGAGEDLGRYIGYGGKTFTSPRWGFLLGDGLCIGLDADARILCQNRIAVSQGNFMDIQDQLKGDAMELFIKIANPDDGCSVMGSGNIAYIQQDLARQLTLYRQDKVILKDTLPDGHVVSVPYRWIVPLNMTYNWSLQNLSSYYTDIGVVRLVLLVVLITGTIWLMVYRPRKAVIPLAAVMGWMIRWVSGSSIMWYGIGLVIWTMLSMLIIFDARTDHDHISHKGRKWIKWIVLGLGLIASIQLVLNFIRIGSQGGSGLFVQYKTANGELPYIDNTLQQVMKPKIGVRAEDVLNLQFPHYKKTIAAIDANPESKEAVLIAGTYMPYFVFNQYNIINDGFLTSMREWFSDGNVCRSYLRLKDKDLTYLVIDPNIATVVMGEGNVGLRDRMFAKIDPQTQEIVQDGAISMLSRLLSSGYIELFNTNNIAAKYAFTLSDADLKQIYGVNDDDLIVLRTKLATARFWGDEGNELLQKALQIMSQRMTNPALGMSDLADIFGKDVDVQKLSLIAQQIGSPTIVNQIESLNQEEKTILANYLTLSSYSQSNPQQYQQSLISLLQQSIGGGSQLITFSVK